MLVQRKTCTFIKQLRSEEFLGEIEFFSGYPRAVTARCTNFVEVLVLYKNDFMICTENYPKAAEMY
jgi:CRP-like cAMP-binding protein